MFNVEIQIVVRERNKSGKPSGKAGTEKITYVSQMGKTNGPTWREILSRKISVSVQQHMLDVEKHLRYGVQLDKPVVEIDITVRERVEGKIVGSVSRIILTYYCQSFDKSSMGNAWRVTKAIEIRELIKKVIESVSPPAPPPHVEVQ